MDPNKSHVPDGSQGFGPGGIGPSYQPGWNPYMYNKNFQVPPAHWIPQGFQYSPSGAQIIPPTVNAQIFSSQNLQPEVPLEETAEAELEILVASQQASASTGTRKKSGTRIKLSNFNPDEDVNLVKSWLEISCDPITSNSQRKDRMWQRILERYNLRRGSYPERTVRSVQSRWEGIKTEVGKFASFMSDVIRSNPSGMTDADKTTRAAADYAGVAKHSFAFMHCWEIMKNEPKWQEPKQKGGVRALSGADFGDPNPENLNTVDLEADTPSPDSFVRKRPIGRDSAKAAKKKSNCSTGSTSSSEYASKMQDLSLQKISIMMDENIRKVDRFQQLSNIEEKRYEELRSHNKSILEIEHEKVRIMRDKLDMQKEKEEDERRKKEKTDDERILAINLDACTSNQRIYYQALQEEILEKMASRRRRTEGS